MFHTDCPSCGASVAFKSSAAVMAVCGYCNSTVYKDASDVADIGKIGLVLEDYSPIQIGTSGVFAGIRFSVVGRLQLRYDAGLWNEWFIWFDDGSSGWLGDASGQYMITQTAEVTGTLPDFESLSPTKSVDFTRIVKSASQSYVVTDVRTAECVGGEGELPFRVGKGYTAKVADLRSKHDFVTLDYSDTHPVAYRGKAVDLDVLECQLLRDDDAIYRSAGRYRGAKHVLDCPHCGSSVAYIAGAATQVNCPSCASTLDMSGDKASVLETHDKQTAKYCSVELGAIATIDKIKWAVIGRLERVDEDDNLWAEYLLYHMQKGFFWLVESPDGWFRADVLNENPGVGSAVTYRGKTYSLKGMYTATVTYAAGAFNWRVQVGDTARVAEYPLGDDGLSLEISQNELAWSASRKMSAEQVAEWFGKPIKSPIVREESAASWQTPMKWMWGGHLLILLLNGFKPFFPWIVVAIASSVVLFIVAHTEDGGGDD